MHDDFKVGGKVIYEMIGYKTYYRKDKRYVTEVLGEIVEVKEKSCMVKLSNGKSTAVINALKKKLKICEVQS